MIIYLHGLNSASTSVKAGLFRHGLAPIAVRSPTYPAHQPQQAVMRLSGMLTALLAEPMLPKQPLILVGSSMGGFYGQYLARRFPVDHLFMINPALRPWELLQQVVGWQHNQALDRRYFLSRQMVADTRLFAIEENCDVPTTLLLDQGDELIDWNIAASIYGDCADVHAFPGGNHGFEHMPEAIAMIARTHQQLVDAGSG